MNERSTITIQVSKTTLTKAKRLFANVELTTADAIEIFLKKMVASKQKKLPLTVIIDRDKDYSRRQTNYLTKYTKRYTAQKLIKKWERDWKRWEKIRTSKKRKL